MNVYPGANIYTGLNAYVSEGRDLLLNLDPTIYVRATDGYTVGTTVYMENFGTAAWTTNGATKSTIDGYQKYIINTSSTNHRTYRVPNGASARNMPSEFEFYAKKEEGSQCNQICVLYPGAVLVVINLDSGAFVGDPGSNIEYKSITSMEDGWYKIYIKALVGGYTGVAVQIGIFDPTNTNDGTSTHPWDATGVDGRILLKDNWYQQLFISQWTDPRNPNRYWEQNDINYAPVVWNDGYGMCMYFSTSQYMTCNSLSSLLVGVGKQWCFAAAIDTIYRSTQKIIWSAGNNTLASSTRNFIFINTASTYLDMKYDDGTSEADHGVITTDILSAAIIDSFNGSVRTSHYGPLSATANYTPKQFSPDVLHLGASPVPNYFFNGRIREVSLTLGRSYTDEQMQIIKNKLTDKYGY